MSWRPGQVRLLSDRLVLRRFASADVDDLVRLNADEGVLRFLARHPPSRGAVTAELSQVIDAYDEHPGFGRFAAQDAAGRFLGWFGLVVDERGTGSPELGYRLRRAMWGNGLATEGSQALVDEAFAELGAERVRAETMVVNAASRRVLDKVGMRHVRTLHKHFEDSLPGTEQGEACYQITRAQWSAQRSKQRAAGTRLSGRGP